MKKKSSASAFFNLRTLVSFSLCLFGLVLTVLAGRVQTPAIKPPTFNGKGAQPGSQTPEVLKMDGPVSNDLDLRELPYIAPTEEDEGPRLTRYPFPMAAAKTQRLQSKPDLVERIIRRAITPKIPTPLLTFGGISSAAGGCGICTPPDTDGDVGRNNYIQSVNSSIRIHDKAGNALTGPITYNSFFYPLGPGTPCGAAQNDGDGVVFYDHVADRWVVSDFAFNGDTTTGAYYQCIGVSKTADPVAGGWYLYAVQVDPANPKNLGDYPKFGVWSDGYYMTVNMFDQSQPTATQFQGVRVYAFDRNSMITGGSANTIAFSIGAADLGDSYSFLPATFRHGNPPPAGQPEWVMSIDSSAPGTVQTAVYVRRFHVDFVTPGNSTFGVGATHAPDGVITVNGFVNAYTSTTQIVPNGTATTTQWLDTLGDKLMYPLVYQNRGGVESIYSSHTIAPFNNGTTNSGPTAVRWYQFNMTGNTIPAAATQQQDWSNGNDGLYRWMPSINVDGEGNVAIGYSASSATVDPGIRYAGRLAGDPLNNLSQGEAVLIAGGGHQTSTGGRWGDYSATFVDPINPCTFWHTHEYYSATSTGGWNTRIGTFAVNPGVCSGTPVALPSPTPAATVTPTPTPIPGATPTPTPSATPSPTAPASAGPVTVTATAATTGPTDYATVKAAFDAINAGTHQGAINIWVMADTTETTSAVLNASGSGSASYTSVLLLPNGTRTVSGAIVAGSPLIDLNGANNVRIDGYGQLTLSNTTASNTASTSTVRFINGASNNVLAGCTIRGSSTSANTTAGGNVLFSTSTAAAGNNNNIVIGNNIGPAGANLPSKCVMSLGTTAKSNTNNVISDNNIFDFFVATASNTGISIAGNNDSWRISSNRIYQTATRTFTTSPFRYAGITVNATTASSTAINFNTIGFGAANGTGTTTISGTATAGGTGNNGCEVRGIDAASTNPATITSIQGNVVSGISQTTSRNSTNSSLAPFIGIAVGTTGGTFDIGNTAGNTIGSLDGSSAITVAETSTTTNTASVIGIFDFSFDADIIANNRVGTFTISSGGTGTVTGFRGILISGTGGQSITVINNTIGGTAPGSINNTIVGTQSVYGIQNASADMYCENNLIRNMSSSSTGAIVAMSGIIQGTANAGIAEIINNTVHSLNVSAGSAAGAIYGMDLTFSTNANFVERNTVHSLTATSTTAGYQLFGIVKRGAGQATVRNNMVRLGLDSAGNSQTGDLSIVGLRDIGTSANTATDFHDNSVYIGGSGVTANTSTYALLSDVATTATVTRSFRDNILFNARSTTSGTGKNYAIRFAGTAPNSTGITSNNNDLFVSGTAGFVGQYNLVDQTPISNWRTATGQDTSSISADPLFVSPTGSGATFNLHIQAGSPAIAAGAVVAGTSSDFDKENRNPSKPDIGADERTAFVPPVPALVSAASRMTHPSAGTFSLSLPLNGSGIEPRSNGSGNFTIVLTFSTPVNQGTASVTGGTGSVSGVTFSGSTMAVDLTGVTDQQVLTLTVNNVVSTSDQVLGSASINIGFLNGDVSNDRVVNVGDTIQTRNHAGQTIDNTNFQFDVNVSGGIDVGDTIVVKAKSGDFLP